MAATLVLNWYESFFAIIIGLSEGYRYVINHACKCEREKLRLIYLF